MYDLGNKFGLGKHLSEQQNITCSYGYLNSYYINYLDATLVLSAVLLAVVAGRIQTCNLPDCTNTLNC